MYTLTTFTKTVTLPTEIYQEIFHHQLYTKLIFENIFRWEHICMSIRPAKIIRLPILCSDLKL